LIYHRDEAAAVSAIASGSQHGTVRAISDIYWSFRFAGRLRGGLAAGDSPKTISIMRLVAIDLGGLSSCWAAHVPRGGFRPLALPAWVR
jgi:hypothetical protein